MSDLILYLECMISNRLRSRMQDQGFCFPSKNGWFLLYMRLSIISLKDSHDLDETVILSSTEAGFYYGMKGEMFSSG